MPWYHDLERWLLHRGKDGIVAGLLIVAGISLVLAAGVYRGRWVVPATAWLAYLSSP